MRVDPITSSERARHIAEIVKSALERPPEDAHLFLDEACAGDAEMRAEVDSLLSYQVQANGFIEQGALNVAAEALARDGSLAGEQVIGGYKILSKIGAGGMGDVYLAEDIQLRRKVALKLVRAALSTDDIVARFRHEEQILASLNDPNIAHLYGGGVTPNGIPFFAMEYIEGLRIDQYCERRGLNIAERLQLFRKVCSAVHYAHQHLVIHRDLKPSNILVTEAGEPKLLDFGIAKLLKTDEATPVVTLVGVMTPDYASPEQVRGESITTASDVYSLGVVLYRLLTGQSPYRTQTNRPDEIARAITDQDTDRPSASFAITKRHSNRPSLFSNPHSRSLRGDLDNIALMALRKDPARRYASVAQFSEDIRRHLDGLPVIARKDTFSYRSTKFIKRHRVGVLAAVLVFLTLLGGIAMTTWQKRKAVRRFNDIQKLAHSLLFEILPKFAPLPGTSEAREIAVKRALEYLDILGQEAGNDPVLMRDLVLAYRSLGEQIDAATGNHAEALKHFRKALALDEALVRISPTDEEARDELARDYERIGWSLCWISETDEARSFYGKALAVREPLVASNPRSFNFRYRLAHLHQSIADLSQSNGETKEALQNYRQALTLVEALSKGQSPELDLRIQRARAYCHNRIGETLSYDNQLTAALEEYDKALAIAELLHSATPDDLDCRSLLSDGYAGQARVYRKWHDYTRALVKVRTWVGLWEPTARNGDVMSRPPLGTAYSELGGLLGDDKNMVSAIEYLQKAILLQEELLTGGVKNSEYTGNLALSYERLGLVQRKLGTWQAALQNYDKALRLREQNAADVKNGFAQNDLASCCKDIGLLRIDMALAKDATVQETLSSWREARSHCGRSLEIFQKLVRQHPERDLFQSQLEEVQAELNRCDQVLAHL